ncbi:unnamed protein product [Triticum turgidum subsp. durum]|uniref:Uncharacterized protein n=1 Tax=Triticum turgidum subsp. durum TaxID=4567 RepID=A0A9R1NJ83_TRITD|nr:unnamed protein product [Triticum turgidum subsp. durum]
MLVRYARLICLESSPRPQPPLPLIPHTMAVQPLLLEAVPQTISFSVRGCLLILDTLLKTKSCPDLLDIINMNGIFPCLFATIIFKDLDLTRPAAPRNPPRPQFETSTKEVLRKADFRVSKSAWQPM